MAGTEKKQKPWVVPVVSIEIRLCERIWQNEKSKGK